MIVDKNKQEQSDGLIKAIGKSELLVEEHQESLMEFDDETEEIEGWLTILLKALKSTILN